MRRETYGSPLLRFRASQSGDKESGGKDEVWRTLDVATCVSVEEFHDLLAVAFGDQCGRNRVEPGDRDLWWDGLPEYWLDARTDSRFTFDHLLHGLPNLVAYEYDTGGGRRRRVDYLGAVEDDGSHGRFHVVDVFGGQPPPRAASPWTDPDLEDMPVDVGVVRRALRREFDGIGAADGWGLALGSLGQRMPPDLRSEFWDYLDRAEREDSALSRAVVFDPAAAEESLRAYRWLLEAVGADGLPLTDAGELPPGLGAEAGERLQSRTDGDPGAALLDGALRGGLVRRQKGRLIRMAAARDAQDDPVALLAHMACRWRSFGRRDQEQDARVLLALEIAVGGDPRSQPALDRIAYGLRALRCGGRWYDPVPPPDTRELVSADLGFLASLGLAHPGGETARAFARTALHAY